MNSRIQSRTQTQASRIFGIDRNGPGAEAGGEEGIGSVVAASLAVTMLSSKHWPLLRNRSTFNVQRSTSDIQPTASLNVERCVLNVERLRGKRVCLPGMALGVALACLLTVRDRSQGQDGSLEPATVKVEFTKTTFVGVNQNDAEAAFKVFTEIAGKKRGYLVKAQSHVFDNLSNIEATLTKGGAVMIIMDTWEYLSLRRPELVEPQFAPMEQGILLKKYVLLTRRGSGLNKLADLRGKHVTILDNANVNLSQQWLEVLLLEDRLGKREAFFGGSEVVGKASAAVLPVFFGTKHACVVDEPAFDIMKELNPQVGHRLQVVATSEPFLDGLIAFSRSGWASPTHKEELYRGLAELHLEPDGQQILTLFRTTRLLPFKESYLETVRELWAKHERLRGENR